MNWMVLGCMAFLLAIINLIRSFMGKRRGWEILMFASLSTGAMTLLSEYKMVNMWLQKGDWSALEDVVPGMTQMLASALVVGIILNLVTLVVNLRKGK